MSARRRYTTVIAVFFTAVVAMWTMNLVIDPYSVFGTSSLPDGAAMNERFVKIEWLRESNESYEALILASSRSGMTQPASVKARSGLDTYNLSVFSARPSDMLSLYGGYRETRPPPKMVLLGLDVMGFLDEADTRGLAREHHPSITGKASIRFWTGYLLAASIVPSIDKVRDSDAPRIQFDVSKGTYTLSGYDADIKRDHDAYQARMFASWNPPYQQSTVDEAELQALAILMERLSEDAVEVRAFLQPMHRQWADRMAPVYKALMPHLTKIPGFIDLSELARDDDALWYEQKHYRGPVSERVLDSVLPRLVARPSGRFPPGGKNPDK